MGTMGESNPKIIDFSFMHLRHEKEKTWWQVGEKRDVVFHQSSLVCFYLLFP